MLFEPMRLQVSSQPANPGHPQNPLCPGACPVPKPAPRSVHHWIKDTSEVKVADLSLSRGPC